jgi:phosphosulfolactate phosphohydrolase-like enzyme
MGDTARISMMLAERTGSETEEFLKSTDSGKRLLSTGYKDDIIYCSKRGTSDVLPELKEGRIIASAR